MGYSGNDKRKFERFDLQVAGKLTNKRSDQPIKMHTRDISASGTFCCPEQPLEQGTRVTLEIFLSNPHLEKLTGSQSCLRVQGKVIRCEQKGVAIQFSGTEQILPIQSMMDN